MNKPKYGFTEFLDCSHNPAQFRTVANEDLPNPFGKITERTHIETRQIAYPTVDITAMARLAITSLFEKLNIQGKDCAGVVLASCNSQDQSDSLENIAAKAAKTHGIASSTSLNFACSGFPAAIERAMEMDNEEGRHIIVIMAEMLSKIVDWNDENTAVVFGDGLAVTSIIPEGRHEILDAWARGDVEDPNHCLGFERKTGTLTPDGVIDDLERLVITMGKRGGRYLYKDVPGALLKLTDDPRFGGLKNIDRIVPHQANGKFIEKIISLIRKLHLEREIPVVGTIKDQANTASASVPTALAKTIHTYTPGEIVGCPVKGAGEEFEEGRFSHGFLRFKVGE
jgi:3-oxoacyl-[acyl-carrier-protein] synthase-3